MTRDDVVDVAAGVIWRAVIIGWVWFLVSVACGCGDNAQPVEPDAGVDAVVDAVDAAPVVCWKDIDVQCPGDPAQVRHVCVPYDGCDHYACVTDPVTGAGTTYTVCGPGTDACWMHRYPLCGGVEYDICVPYDGCGEWYCEGQRYAFCGPRGTWNP